MAKAGTGAGDNGSRITDLGSRTEQYMDATAALIGLPIPSECRAGVIENLERMQQIAQLVMSFPLPADVEPANTFKP
ncbi:MAG TPA: DUF4089 domain-containing protein [Burkholderiaceae bacterium]|nr:DUF4089 domain-containing protein [Burkholderiaceae bacterium]